MIRVELLAHTNVDPYELAQHAAGTCYQAKMPEFGQGKQDVKGRLFEKGHHTPLEHWSATFAIEGIAVSDVTFGLHLAHPFYNTDQRSGRFCGEMFDDPDYGALDFINQTWNRQPSLFLIG
ncbi:MAG: hypothetical protein UV67_C0011G0027 [Parcubacteria group bacterium GW2011_GWC1_43_12]|nr:MAG: hypothetical protein UV67_C0011G0027 [Parcubacteria group bacterium GW2011_GWC1_43_12]